MESIISLYTKPEEKLYDTWFYRNIDFDIRCGRNDVKKKLS